MYDIDFIKILFHLKKILHKGKLSLLEVENIEKELENLEKAPTIFNIETTNYCNMKCVFCARTIYMERKNIWINDDLFEKMLDQVATHDHKKLNNFLGLVKKRCKVKPRRSIKNGFYFSVVSRCLILHGYGEPFLDKYLIKRLEACKRNIPTYFRVHQLL